MSTVTDHHPLRRAVEAEDWNAVDGLLHDDVAFRSPAVHAAYRGKAACLHLLGHVKEVFEDFRYVDQLQGGTTTGLVFRARVGDRDLEGWDYLAHDEDGRITEFAVMIRPLSGLIAVAQAMGARLESDPVPTS